MPPKKIFDNIERDRARVTKILRTTDVTLGDTGPITITGKLSKESRESLVDSIMDSLQLRWTDEEKLFWAASRCEHSAREITVAEGHICACGIKWHVPDPGYPFRPLAIVGTYMGPKWHRDEMERPSTQDGWEDEEDTDGPE